MSYFIYILRTNKNTLYVGQTHDIVHRMKQHQEKTKKSAKYLRMFSSVELVYQEEVGSLSDALKREAELKKWPKAKKELFIRKS